MTAFKKGRRKTGGRKKSTPNKISSMLISAEWRTAIFEHFKDHKQEVLDLLLKEFPNKYAEIMAGFAAREQQLAANNPLMGEQRGDPIHVIERIIIDPKTASTRRHCRERRPDSKNRKRPYRSEGDRRSA